MDWFVAKNGEQTGPHTEDAIRAMLARGEVLPESLVWHAGMSDWQPLREVLDSQAKGESLAESTIQPEASVDNAAATTVEASAHTKHDLALRSERLFAYLLDNLFAILAALPGIIVVAMHVSLSGFSEMDEEAFVAEMLGSSLIGLVLVLLGIFAFVIYQVYLLTTRGQTVGKKLLGIRIVMHETGRNPGFVHAVLIRSFAVSLIASIPTVGAVFSLVNILFIFREDRRCLHDLLASTSVVKV